MMNWFKLYKLNEDQHQVVEGISYQLNVPPNEIVQAIFELGMELAVHTDLWEEDNDTFCMRFEKNKSLQPLIKAIGKAYQAGAEEG